MARLRRIVLLRHGETVGNSKERFHGSNDVALSEDGRAQMRAAAQQLAREVFDTVAASPLRRSWESARIVSGGARVLLESRFREVDFGRWEGLTAEEIQAADPALYEDWRARREGFEFPGGELRADFRARVIDGLESLERSGSTNVLLVIHKGVIRTIAEHLLGKPLEDGIPPLAGMVSLTRGGDGHWFPGRHSSDPEGLEVA